MKLYFTEDNCPVGGTCVIDLLHPYIQYAPAGCRALSANTRPWPVSLLFLCLWLLFYYAMNLILFRTVNPGGNTIICQT